MAVNKVQLVFSEFGDEVCDILGDAEACQRWLKDFHDGLLYRRAGRSAFADRLLAEAETFIDGKRSAGSKGGKARVARERAARKKQKDLEVLVKPTLPGTSSGNGEALNDEGATAPAGKNLERADAHAREGAEAVISGFATSPSEFQNQKRPGKSADKMQSSYGKSIREGGSERGADGLLTVRRSPGAGKRPEPPTLEELYAFASDACLHEMLCREWWEMTYGDRAGLDRDGRPIRNWKAACRAYVKKRISNMENET